MHRWIRPLPRAWGHAVLRHRPPNGTGGSGSATTLKACYPGGSMKGTTDSVSSQKRKFLAPISFICIRYSDPESTHLVIDHPQNSTLNLRPTNTSAVARSKKSIHLFTIPLIQGHKDPNHFKHQIQTNYQPNLRCPSPTEHTRYARNLNFYLRDFWYHEN